MLNITEGKVRRPLKSLIYGSEGIGKSTLAAQYPKSLFIDTEGGTSHMDVRRLQKPDSWDSLVAMVHEVSKNPGICGTLVLDTADWAELLCIESICRKFKKAGLEDFGYGKGYTYLSEEFTKLLNSLDAVINAGMNVVITAHAKMRKFEQPDEMGAYDRWEMKLSKQVAPLLKEWADMVLFLNYKTTVITTETKSKKATGGKRVMYTTHHPCWDAKNRFGLPEEMELGFEGIAHLFFMVPQMVKAAEEVPQQPIATPLSQLQAMLLDAKIAEFELQRLVASRGYFPESLPVAEYPTAFITSWVIPNFAKIKETIESDDSRLPF